MFPVSVCLAVVVRIHNAYTNSSRLLKIHATYSAFETFSNFGQIFTRANDTFLSLSPALTERNSLKSAHEVESRNRPEI